MPFFKTKDNTNLFYQDWGTGDPVVFISGWALSSRMWDYQRVYLADHGLRCIAYDRRSHGRSDDPGLGYDFDTLSDDLAALIEHSDLENVTLVGHSMGTGEVVRYLTRHGDHRIKRAVLMSGSVPFLLKTEDNPDGIDGGLAETVRNAWNRNYPEWLVENEPPYFAAGVLNDEGYKALGEWTRWDMLQCSLKAVIDCNRTVVETDFREEMPSIYMPTLIIHGDLDQSIPLAISGKKSAELLPNNRLLVYKNGPHGLYMTHRDQLNRDLLTFIKDSGHWQDVREQENAGIVS